MLRLGLMVVAIVACLLASPALAGAATYRFPAVADTYAAALSPLAANGTLPHLQVASAASSHGYLRFDVRGLDGPVQAAYLELFALEDAGPAGVTAHAVTPGGWSEGSLVRANAPPLGAALDETGSFSAQTRVYLDVKSHIAGDGPVGLGLSTSGVTRRWFASRETSTPPRLIVVTPGPGDGTSTAPPPTFPAAPSGVPMPTGDRPGWRRVFSDDFVGTALDEDRWGAYWGQPAGDPGGWWEPSHVEVGGGAAILRTYRDPAVGGRWVSGGMSSAPALKQRYGKYEVRFRMDAGYGIFPVLLLFASADRWPPEIDFAEDGGNTRVRDHMNATLHYGVRPNNRQIQRRVFADFTRWHTMGVEWTAGRIAYTLDGEVWATLTGPNVPAERMELDIQTQAGTQGDRWNPAPDDSTPPEVDMQVDWVVAYAPDG